MSPNSEKELWRVASDAQATGDEQQDLVHPVLPFSVLSFNVKGVNWCMALARTEFVRPMMQAVICKL
ncbi:hypothetical protein SE91_26430 [Bradyrhizobium sp. DOA1]|nr:hypothetical protein SE91_26430 [Bradyrhizobium sp. DOA1]